MRLYRLNRKVHYWLTLGVTLPLLIVVLSGLLLQLKKHVSWVQPPEQRGTGTAPKIDFEQILASARSARPDATDWDSVNRIDVRPSRGVAKVWLESGWEVQVDLASGRVLQSEYRRSDLIESIHDGSFFAGQWSKLGIFLPAAVALLVMLLSGVWMFLHPILGRRRSRRGR